MPQAVLHVAGLLPSLHPSAGARGVGRLLDGDRHTIGTAVHVGRGIVVTCRHNIGEEGRCLEGVTAFGLPLKFRASSAKLDLVVFKMEATTAPGVDMAPGVVAPGDAIYVLHYPLAVDTALLLQDKPVVSSGHVVAVGSSMQHATADYTGMPNSSGGAVLDAHGQLVGLHAESVFHLEGDLSSPRSHPGGASSSSVTSEGTPSAGSSAGGAADVGGGVRTRAATTAQAAAATFGAIERDPTELFQDLSINAVEHAAAAARQGNPEQAIQLAIENVAHKGQMPLFLLVGKIMEFLVEIKEVADEVEGSRKRGRTGA